jgi:HTH-type transcriptional regulator/antitoxin HigA
MTKWKSIASKAEYKAATARINELMDIKRTDVIHNELSLLSFLVEDYDNEYNSLPDASPLEVIKFVMEMKDIKQQDLIPILGTKGNVSKILNGKANIQLEDLQPLSSFLGIPAEVLIPKSKTYKESVSVMSDYAAEPGKKFRKKKN